MRRAGEDSAGRVRDRLILGLGNPGQRYLDTRHNLGFRVVGELSRRVGARPPRLECNSLVAIAEGLVLSMPQTYMNRSGHAARCLVERRGIPPEDILVIYDEVHLPLGRVRLRPRGSPGGHRGMESVIHSLRTSEIARLRLGVAPDEDRGIADLVEYVLEEFRVDEREIVDQMVGKAADAAQCWLAEGSEVAMGRFNG